jgi:hypothetical protein
MRIYENVGEKNRLVPPPLNFYDFGSPLLISKTLFHYIRELLSVCACFSTEPKKTNSLLSVYIRELRVLPDPYPTRIGPGPGQKPDPSLNLGPGQKLGPSLNLGPGQKPDPGLNPDPSQKSGSGSASGSESGSESEIGSGSKKTWARSSLVYIVQTISY